MFGYKDVQDYILTAKPLLGEDADPTTLAGKYTEALPPATIVDEKE